MDRKILLSIGALALAALAIALLLPGAREADRNPLLPWQMRPLPDGGLEVFGLKLGESSLAEAQRILEHQGKVSLFRAPDGRYSLESYFQNLNLSGLRADFVLSLALSPEQAETYFSRGARISTLGSGTQKVTLSDSDRTSIEAAAIKHLTYLPRTSLSAELIRNRFGPPQRRFKDAAGMEHWLYPEKGLDIARNDEGDTVFQYLPPRRFEQLEAPLSPQP